MFKWAIIDKPRLVYPWEDSEAVSVPIQLLNLHQVHLFQFHFQRLKNISLNSILSLMNWGLEGLCKSLQCFCIVYTNVTYHLSLFGAIRAPFWSVSSVYSLSVISWLIDKRNLMRIARIKLTCWQAALHTSALGAEMAHLPLILNTMIFCQLVRDFSIIFK